MADVGDLKADGSQLRERPSAKPLHLNNSDDAKQKVLKLNDQEDKDHKNDESKKRTYGRTPDGTVFIVPQTHDMVSQLLSPSQPKNLSDIAVLAVLASLILTFYALPKSARVPIFAIIFLFWRAGYNAGIGWLLDGQSKHNRLVLWAKQSHIFEKPETGKNPNPALYKLLKRELETKIPKDYKFEEAPLEYNTWLVFRRVVDLILMCDFVSYCLFALACFNRPQESWFLWALRWTTGIILFLFNLWVKLDAHRVVKDFAWYWGDFFYLIDQSLTFDGVFEMAPHPMYSVGYAGYYGIALMMASYKVLAISIIAHAAQFAFLILVESRHIDKLYNPPPPRRTRHNSGNVAQEDVSKIGLSDFGGETVYDPTKQPAPTHHIVGPHNTDFHRSIDVTVVLLSFYMTCLATLTPNTLAVKTFLFVNAFAWRLWYTLGLGYILDRQSKKKNWTKHFIKYGDTKEEAWRQWKSLYHLSMTMSHASFVALAWKMYSLPPDGLTGLTLFRHVLGAGMIALQVWTAMSIYESLGEFGWFCGDFFFDPPSKSLTYNGIYRFLNNPERVLGLAGVWGIAIITWSPAVFYVATTAHILNLAFLQFVEKPHVIKLYGENLREMSGVSKTVRQALPDPVRQWQSAADQYINTTVESIEAMLDRARSKFAGSVDTFVNDTTSLFKSYPARIPISRHHSEDLSGLNLKQYKLEIEGTTLPPAVEQQKNGGREGELARTPAIRTNDFKTLCLEYGAPIRVRWQAPLNHSKKDWIGLYMVTDNQSRKVTRISSNGRWVATNPDAFDSTRADDGILVSDKLLPANDNDEESTDCYTGEVEFHGDKLWWTTGVFEFRYHHGGRHHVMALSQAFEIRIPKFDETDVEVDDNGTIHRAVEETLLPIIQNCFDRDPEIAPSTSEEPFGSLVERDGKFARRVVFAVHQMFGIEFAPEVVQADGTVRNLAWRICNAKKVLVSHSFVTIPRGCL
ncbi:Phosphatidylethanolamine N-methyltransferase [Pyrenophora tritici-repentis]|nr:Phosphatidylethanolamine N-methyltransferase [Pyrenophora tritici-repentis]